MPMEVVAVESVTLDGVMQATGRPDEDERGGFAHGGWAVPYNDPVMGRAMGARMARGGALLLGRRTYEDLHGYWPGTPPRRAPPWRLAGAPPKPFHREADAHDQVRRLDDPARAAAMGELGPPRR